MVMSHWVLYSLRDGRKRHHLLVEADLLELRSSPEQPSIQHCCWHSLQCSAHSKEEGSLPPSFALSRD